MRLFIVLICILFFSSCTNNDDFSEKKNTCPSIGLLETFTDSDGQELYIYDDGKLFSKTNENCQFELQYYTPGFLETNYLTNDEETFVIAEENALFPVKNTYSEDFENGASFVDLFISSLDDSNLYWTNFTVQSPSAPEVSDYVALNKCILDNTCSFIDNNIELTNDPTDASNTVMKFTSVPPTANMVTSKASISSTINYYLKNSELWFEADYYIESGIPYSLIDFENSYFFQNPGPRVVVRNNRLELENKFGSKSNYENNSGLTIPQNEWFTLKVHLKFSNEDDGIIELWQDETQIISTTGINLPTSNSIQNILEVGVTASNERCILLFDNMRISDSAF